MTNNGSMTIFNRRVDKEERRDWYIPTVIDGVCWYATQSTGMSQGSNKQERTDFASTVIRVPIKAQVQGDKAYIAEKEYEQLSDEEAEKYWTIQLDCYVWKGEYAGAEGTKLHVEDIRELSKEAGDLIQVTEYADDTVRGTDRAKHWRIGGA